MRKVLHRQLLSEPLWLLAECKLGKLDATVAQQNVMSWRQSKVEDNFFDGEVLLHERILGASGDDVFKYLIHHLPELIAAKAFLDCPE